MTTITAAENTMPTTTTTHWIPKAYLGDLTKEVARLAKKAERLGLPAVTWRLTGREEVRDLTRLEQDHPGPDGLREHTYRVRCTEVEVTSPDIQVAGFTLIASVEPRESGNILRSVGGDLPPEYRTRPMDCDHCRVSRRRKTVYVVREDATGNLITVGSTCLADFTQCASAGNAASGFEHLADVVDAFRGAALGGGLPAEALGWSLTLFLCYVLESERQHGFVTRRDLDRLPDDTRTTGSNAWSCMTDGRQRLLHLGPAAADEALAARHGAAAAAVVAWHAGRRPVTDFDHNCHVLACDDALTSRDANIAAAMVLSHRRAERERTESEAARARRPVAGEHIGSVGARLRDLAVQCERITPMQERRVAHNVYTQAHLHVFRTDGGDVVKWFSSSQVLEVGRRYLLTGTVKEHGEYRGVPETVLTRCAVADA